MTTRRKRPTGPFKKCRLRTLCRAGVLGLYVGSVPMALGSAAHAAEWNVGHVFAGIGGSRYQVYDNGGTAVETISHGMVGGLTIGCAFNPALTRLYTTDFSVGFVVVYDDAHPHPILQRIDTKDQGNKLSFGASTVVFRSDGSFFVGHGHGDGDIHEYNAAGDFVRQFNVAGEPFSGSIDIDLANDQNTIFYTSQQQRVLRYDTARNVQLADFSNALTRAHALRLLPPGDGTGGVLVANLTDIKRLDASGNVVQTYGAAGQVRWTALALDPNGTSFWAATSGQPSGNPSNLYRFNIATGAVEVGPIDQSTTNGSLGLCLKGEPRATTLPPTPHLDHFLLYKVARKEIDDERGGDLDEDDLEEDEDRKLVVVLNDQFDAAGQTRRFVVKSPQRLGNPVDKNHEGINDEASHLVAYEIRRATGELRHARLTRVKVTNQFGEILLDTHEPDRLMVPSAKSLTGPVEPPTNGRLDHFKCYPVHVTKGATPLHRIDVSLVDQFEQPRRYRVTAVDRLCTPVDSEAGGIKNRDDHLLCYDIRRAKGQPRTTRVNSIHTNNQFGPLVLEAPGPRELCVPAKKDLSEAVPIPDEKKKRKRPRD